jgi:hypothetical protein
MARSKNHPVLFNLAELRRLALMLGAAQVDLFCFSRHAYLHYLPPEPECPDAPGEFSLHQVSIPGEGILFLAIFRKSPGYLHFPAQVNP